MISDVKLEQQHRNYHNNEKLHPITISFETANISFELILNHP